MFFFACCSVLAGASVVAGSGGVLSRALVAAPSVRPRRLRTCLPCRRPSGMAHVVSCTRGHAFVVEAYGSRASGRRGRWRSGVGGACRGGHDGACREDTRRDASSDRSTLLLVLAREGAARSSCACAGWVAWRWRARSALPRASASLACSLAPRLGPSAPLNRRLAEDGRKGGPPPRPLTGRATPAGGGRGGRRCRHLTTRPACSRCRRASALCTVSRLAAARACPARRRRSPLAHSSTTWPSHHETRRPHSRHSPRPAIPVCLRHTTGATGAAREC